MTGIDGAFNFPTEECAHTEQVRFPLANGKRQRPILSDSSAQPSFAGNSVLGPGCLIAAASCYLSTRLVLLPTPSSLELGSNNIFGQFVEHNCRSISDYSIIISRFRPRPNFTLWSISSSSSSSSVFQTCTQSIRSDSYV